MNTKPDTYTDRPAEVIDTAGEMMFVRDAIGQLHQFLNPEKLNIGAKGRVVQHGNGNGNRWKFVKNP